MNSCTFCGRVVADAELRYSQSGTAVLRVRVASDTGWGERKQTHWLDCSVFGTRGERLAPHLRKGTPVTVVGDLEPPRLYESKSGETRAAQSLVVRELAMHGRADAAAGHPPGAGQGAATQTPQSAAQSAQAPSGGSDLDSDIPF